MKLVACDRFSSAEAKAIAFLGRRYPRSLLALGDMMAPLRPLTDLVIGEDHENVVAAAALFKGFAGTIVALVGDQSAAANALLEMVVADRTIVTLVIEINESVPDLALSAPSSVDAWMIRPITGGRVDERVVSLVDPHELLAFYRELEMAYWTSAMLQFGHAFGIRDRAGNLLCAAGLNFLLPEYGYAQFGSLATAPASRGIGLGSTVMTAVVHSLAGTGVKACGLFADSRNRRLLDFYRRNGFVERGYFRFFDLGG